MGVNESKSKSKELSEIYDSNTVILNKCPMDGDSVLDPTKGVWLYKSSKNNHWWFMSSYLSDAFEQWYVDPDTRPSHSGHSGESYFIVTHNNCEYKIDFDKMTQTKMTTNAVRKIMRMSPEEIPHQSMTQFIWTYTTGSGDKKYHELAQPFITEYYNNWIMHKTHNLYPEIEQLQTPEPVENLLQPISDSENDNNNECVPYNPESAPASVSVLAPVYVSNEGLVINDNIYRFDFNKMEQLNVSTGRRRSMKYQIQV